MANSSDTDFTLNVSATETTASLVVSSSQGEGSTEGRQIEAAPAIKVVAGAFGGEASESSPSSSDSSESEPRRRTVGRPGGRRGKEATKDSHKGDSSSSPHGRPRSQQPRSRRRSRSPSHPKRNARQDTPTGPKHTRAPKPAARDGGKMAHERGEKTGTAADTCRFPGVLLPGAPSPLALPTPSPDPLRRIAPRPAAALGLPFCSAVLAAQPPRSSSRISSDQGAHGEASLRQGGTKGEADIPDALLDPSACRGHATMRREVTGAHRDQSSQGPHGPAHGRQRTPRGAAPYPESPAPRGHRAQPHLPTSTRGNAGQIFPAKTRGNAGQIFPDSPRRPTDSETVHPGLSMQATEDPKNYDPPNAAAAAAYRVAAVAQRVHPGPLQRPPTMTPTTTSHQQHQHQQA